MARTKKKVTDTIEKVEENVQETIPTTPKRISKKKVTKVEPEVVKEVIEKSSILPKKSRKSKKDNKPKLSAVPPEKVEEVKEKVVTESPKKKWKPPVKTKDFYEFEEGKYVLGDVEELFDEKLLKKMKTSIKKLSKKNHGKDDKLGIYYFKVGDKVWDFIEYNSKILTASNSLILCKSETVTKEGKLRFCRRFEAKESFRVEVDYTDEDWCLYFWYKESPSPFMMLQGENLI